MVLEQPTQNSAGPLVVIGDQDSSHISVRSNYRKLVEIFFRKTPYVYCCSPISVGSFSYQAAPAGTVTVSEKRFFIRQTAAGSCYEKSFSYRLQAPFSCSSDVTLWP